MLMDLKTSKWILLPACLFLGLALLVTFVSISQDYLSEYLVRNSKDRVGEKLDPQKLSELLEEPRLATPPSPSVLVFWSVSCAPCLEKLKDVPDLGRGGRNVFPINTDPDETHPAAKQILASAMPGQAFLHDRNKTLETELEIDYLPTHVYLAVDGTIEKIEIGKK